MDKPEPITMKVDRKLIIQHKGYVIKNLQGIWLGEATGKLATRDLSDNKGTVVQVKTNTAYALIRVSFEKTVKAK